MFLWGQRALNGWSSTNDYLSLKGHGSYLHTTAWNTASVYKFSRRIHELSNCAAKVCERCPSRDDITGRVARYVQVPKRRCQTALRKKLQKPEHVTCKKYIYGPPLPPPNKPLKCILSRTSCRTWGLC